MTKRKVLFVPVGAIAFVICIAATAYACTVFKGTLTVTGNASSASVTTTGLRSGMLQTVSPGVAKASKNGGSFTMSTGTDGCCNRLPSTDAMGATKTYVVRFYNSASNRASKAGYNPHTNWVTDCMAGDAGVTIGQVRLDANGQIAQMLVGSSWTSVSQPLQFSLASGLRADTGASESAVCLSDVAAAFGNQAPLTIV